MNGEIKILILEDNEMDAELLQRLLRKEMPYAILFLATNRNEYLDLLERKPDIILADNSLPQFNATEALAILRKQALRIPFILVTGTVSEEFAAGIIKLGADDYILKDRLARLPSAIDTALEKAHVENERLTAFSRLIESEERYRALIERITDAFIALDENWNYTFINKQAGELIRRDPRSLIGKNIWQEFPDVVGTATYNAFMLAMKEQRYIMNVDHYEPLNLWQENHIYPSHDGVSVFIRDISNRKHAENEIIQKNRELQELSSHLQNIREEERISIAREIHDELGQQLTGLKMDLHWLQKKLTTAEEPVKNKIEESVNLINDTIVTVRRIVADLRPAILDDLGLVSALCWHGEQIEKRFEIKVQFSTSVQHLKIPPQIATGIFRIYQEVLTNAVKHANARHITSNLDLVDETLQLVIKDDGKGMDTSATPEKSFGLVGIRERVFILGGTFKIKSELGKGTEAQINIPYQMNK